MIIPKVPGIWTIGGRAGAGKTRLAKTILENVYMARPLRRVVTRPKRASDSAAEYLHMSLEEFNRRDQAGEFFEPVEIHGNMNGVFRTDLDAAFNCNHVVLADLNARNTEKLYRYGLERQGARMRTFKSVYLHTTNEAEIRRRLQERGEKEIERRIEDCRGWFDDVRNSHLHFHIIDADQSPEKVYAEALAFFDSP